MTPDWAAKPITVPYANFGNPQSLNLYTYGKNNPTTLGDPDGHFTDYYDNKANKIGTDGVNNGKNDVVLNKNDVKAVKPRCREEQISSWRLATEQCISTTVTKQ